MIKQFILGMVEFNQEITTHFEDCYYYDKGRELMHRITLRRFEK